MREQMIFKWTHISEIHSCKLHPFLSLFIISIPLTQRHVLKFKTLFWAHRFVLNQIPISLQIWKKVWLNPRQQLLNNLSAEQHLTKNIPLALKSVTKNVPLLPNLCQKRYPYLRPAQIWASLWKSTLFWVFLFTHVNILSMSGPPGNGSY